MSYVFENKSFLSAETVLQDNERIVGVRSRNEYKNTAYHSCFQFVIGQGFELAFIKVLRNRLSEHLMFEISKY